MIKNFARVALVWAASQLTGYTTAAWAVPTLQPAGDEVVLEILPVITRTRPAALNASTKSTSPQPADPAAAALAAQQDIQLARQTGETRHWGRAQAQLSPWWNRANAPPDIAILQTTVQQGRHEFEAARKLLTATLTRAPGHAQGWLNLAALERLSARYPQALAACEQVARAGQALHARACYLETVSLQGQHVSALQGLGALVKSTSDLGLQSWLLSLLAESQERAGHDAAAAEAYQRSLKLEPDLYTAIAWSDLLLRTGQNEQALKVLAPLPETDAVLLRRARAWKQLGDGRWRDTLVVLKERTAELTRRGDDPSLHGRELALAALWLDDDAAHALSLARSNLLLQREPLDWWVAVQSATQARDGAALNEIAGAIRTAGLQDVRLALRAAPVTATKTAKAQALKSQ